MKNLICIFFSAIVLTGCSSTISREGAQDGEKSPCACLEYEIFNGNVYEVKTMTS